MQCADLACSFDVKSQGGKESAAFHGIASTNDIDLHGDILEAGCFLPIPTRMRGGAAQPDVLLLRDHDRAQVIGGWTRIEQQGRELIVEGELCLAVPKARETYALMQKGFLSGLSVGFMPDKDGVHYDDRAGRRHIRKGTLREVSIVGMPANESARITLVKSGVVQWLSRRGCTIADIELAVNTALETMLAKKSRVKQDDDDDNDVDVPEPEDGESRAEFMRRCRDEVLDETEDEAEANRLCAIAWRDRNNEERQRKADPEKPWGDVQYADPGYQDDGVKRYPLDIERRIRAAWNYIHQERNRRFYTARQLELIEGRIIAAWKRKIDPDGPPAYQEERSRKRKAKQEQLKLDIQPLDLTEMRGILATWKERANA